MQGETENGATQMKSITYDRYGVGGMRNTIERAANAVTLAVVVDPVEKELYGVSEPALDENATLRRVALFAYGTGRATLSAAERSCALDVIRGRFEEKYSR